MPILYRICRSDVTASQFPQDKRRHFWIKQERANFTATVKVFPFLERNRRSCSENSSQSLPWLRKNSYSNSSGCFRVGTFPQDTITVDSLLSLNYHSYRGIFRWPWWCCSGYSTAGSLCKHWSSESTLHPPVRSMRWRCRNLTWCVNIYYWL